MTTNTSCLKEKNKKPKTPNTTAAIFCILSKSLQLTYREFKSHLPNDSVLLKISWTSATLSLKRNKTGTFPPEYRISAVCWKEIGTLKVSSLLTPSPPQPCERYLSFLCLTVRRELIVLNCSSRWHVARTWPFLDVFFENVNCHLWKLLSITVLTQKSTCKKTSEKKNFWLNNDCGIRSVIKKIKPVYYLAFVARDILHKS